MRDLSHFEQAKRKGKEVSATRGSFGFQAPLLCTPSGLMHTQPPHFPWAFWFPSAKGGVGQAAFQRLVKDILEQLNEEDAEGSESPSRVGNEPLWEEKNRGFSWGVTLTHSHPLWLVSRKVIPH